MYKYPQTRTRDLACTPIVVRMARRLLLVACIVKDLSKKKLGKLSKALETAQAAFRAEVEKLAEQARAEILPYFKKHNYNYVAGNGTWFISKPAADDADYYRPELHVEDDDLPENIRAVLYLEIEYNQPLGYFIADIKRGEW